MNKFINIDRTDYINAINLHLNIYNPLKGFVTHKEFVSILQKKKINNINFTIPINLFCTKDKANKFRIGENINLKFKNEIVGILKLESKFEIQKKNF